MILVDLLNQLIYFRNIIIETVDQFISFNVSWLVSVKMIKRQF